MFYQDCITTSINKLIFDLVARCSIAFLWNPSHKAILGNKIADRLAHFGRELRVALDCGAIKYEFFHV